MTFGFSIDERNGVRVIRLRGELDLATADMLSEGLSNLETSAVVVDLSGLTFLDSSGIAALVKEYNRRGELALCNPRPNVARVLRIAGLDGWVVNARLAGRSDPNAGSGADQQACG